MKKLLLIVLILCAAAQAQYMTVTASSCIGDGAGSLLANGVLTIVGTDQNNRPIPYRAGSSSQSTTVPITRGIAAGSLTASLQLADPAFTSPTNVRYHFTILDNVTKRVTDYPLIMLVANDVFVTSAFTQFNICKMNPLPNTTSIMTPTVSVTNNASEIITGDLNVQGNTTLTGGSSKLGIGTGSPVSPLDIKYTDNTVAFWMRRASNNNPTHKFESNASGDGSMDIATNGAAKIHFTSVGNSWIVGGNFGIGIGVPSLAFHVRHDTSTSGYGGVALFESNLGDEQVAVVTTSLGVAKIGTLTAHGFGIFANGIEGIRLNGGSASAEVMVGIVPNGGGFKQTRSSTTGSVPASGFATNGVTWGTPFADVNYTPVCTVFDSSGNITLVSILSQTAAAITLQYHNYDPGAAHTGTVNCHATHD
jgi:hypothetical protein